MDISRYLTRTQIVELWNYYKIGVINTIFGLSLYSGLIYIGVNLYVAQIIGQIAGVIFNYFTFSRHVFSSYQRSIWRYMGAYALNYVLGLGVLYSLHRVIASPYVVGILTAGVLSVVNFFVLKRLVFRTEKR